MTALPDLDKRRPHELELTASAATRLILIARIQRSIPKLKIAIWAKSLSLLPQAFLPPSLSRAIYRSLAFDGDILSFIDEKAGVHAPALNAFPSREDRLIQLELRPEAQYGTLLKDKA